MEGAEPFSAPGGEHGALVLHGFTGTPHSVRGLARALADAGFAVEAPLLPGHGTSVDDMVKTGWADWWRCADEAYRELAERCRRRRARVVVAGLSMGGTLAAFLAAEHAEIAGLVLVNPYVEPPAPSFRDLLRGMRDSGGTSIPSIGSDIADTGVKEVTYDATPIAPLLSLCEALDDLQPRLGRITCPVLVMTSREDHVVPPVSSDILASGVAGPVERVRLARSFHVATLDHDRDEIERRAVAFAEEACSAGAGAS